MAIHDFNILLDRLETPKMQNYEKFPPTELSTALSDFHIWRALPEILKR